MKNIAIANLFDGKSTNNYVNAVERLGEVAIILPEIVEEDNVSEIMKDKDALILTGGGDVSPTLYGEKEYSCSDVKPNRDKTEIILAKYAMAHNIPTLAICRGMQVVNVAFGGTLNQKISESDEHFDLNNTFGFVHKVTAVKGGILSNICGESFNVNSTHRQAIKDIAQGFTINAYSEDGVIEGVEHREWKYLGVQFHPERLLDISIEAKKIFEYII